ncbi:MAG: metabolite traffic protein EboE [Phycisphaeraceae bacterium]
MRDVLGPDTVLGYCTNVHAGRGLVELRENLERYAAAVKGVVSPAAPMGVGLWLPEQAVDELLADDGQGVVELDEFLQSHGLMPFTFNGFPQGDFHRKVVKHRVYRPDWAQHERFEYTSSLALILGALAEERIGEAEVSISTLPIGWLGAPCPAVDLAAAAKQLRTLALVLGEYRKEHGTLVHVDLEPEPGCILQRSEDVVALFKDHLLVAGDEDAIRTHLRVCHDVCHATVMFEDQAQVLATYRAAGIRVGKVQVSSAVRVLFEGMTDEQREEALAQLRQFDEPRYLHQTMIRLPDGRECFYEDLPQALAAHRQPSGEWRVHFHVPIYLERFGGVQTTRQQVVQCLAAIEPGDGIHHFEVETYAWNVLPQELRVDDLGQGIAREMRWLIDAAAARSAT